VANLFYGFVPISFVSCLFGFETPAKRNLSEIIMSLELIELFCMHETI